MSSKWEVTTTEDCIKPAGNDWEPFSAGWRLTETGRQAPVVYWRRKLEADASSNVLSKDEVAKMLGVIPKTVMNLMRSGDFPKGFKVGKNWKWLTSEVEEYMNRIRKETA